MPGEKEMSGEDLIRWAVEQCKKEGFPPHDGHILRHIRGLYDVSKVMTQERMHTLSCIRDGNATNPRSSAKACWDVLQEVVKLEAPHDSK